jgi:hypothetical protein
MLGGREVKKVGRVNKFRIWVEFWILLDFEFEVLRLDESFEVNIINI